MRIIDDAFVCLGAAGLSSSIEDIVLRAIVQLGALGLAYLLVRHLMSQTHSLIRVIEKQQTALETKDQAVAEALQKSTEAMARVANALHDRPCLHGDSRIQKGSD